MYDKKIQLLASMVDLVHIPEEFKFGEVSDDFDTMEIYEELFDYAGEIMDNLPLGSNFNVFRNNKEEVKKFLYKHIEDKNIGFICKVCYEFCVAISDLIN